MPTLDGAAILSVWERGAAQSLGERALTLLELAGIPAAEAAGLPVSARDGALLRIRRRLFGDRIEAVTECGACGEELDVTLSVEDVLRGTQPVCGPEANAEIDGRQVSLRIPNAGDLAALRGIGDVERGVALLLERCLATDAAGGAGPLHGELSQANLAALDEALAAADPGAELRLVSGCPACGAHTGALFDIPSFLWKETQALANDVLYDIHELARAYGWDERTILALSPARRRFYLSALER